MKTIGLIGGMSWESTLPYYEIINKGVNQILGKNHSAKCVIYSVDFMEIEELQYRGEWDKLEEIIIDAGLKLKATGAEFCLLCTNTMHKVVDKFEARTGLKLLHIARVIGKNIKLQNMDTIALLGTIFTMKEDFYKKILQNEFNLRVITPDANDMQIINKIIYTELVKGIIKESSKQIYLDIMNKLKNQGAQGVILGCTEIGLLVKNYELPLFDSTLLHANEAVKFSLDC